MWKPRKSSSLLQSLEILPVKLTGTHSHIDILKSYYIIILRFSLITFFFFLVQSDTFSNYLTIYFFISGKPISLIW